MRIGILGIWEMDGGGKREGFSIMRNASGEEVKRGEEFVNQLPADQRSPGCVGLMSKRVPCRSYWVRAWKSWTWMKGKQILKR